MTTTSRALATLTTVTLGSVLFVWACDSPLPTAPLDEVVAHAEAVVPSPDSTAGEPHFTPMTVRPVLTNAQTVSEVLMAAYPPLLREAGIGGSPVLWIHIATTGEADDARVFESSGYEALDRAALEVARAMVFEPARNGDAVTDAWVQIPIRFAVIR